MFLRHLFVRPLGLVANICLARLLLPEQFGIYGIVASSIALFSIFGDAGLAPALIRSEQEPTPEEEDSIFTLQQLVVGAPLLVLSLAAPFLAAMFHLDHKHIWLVRLVALSGFIATFRTIPSVRLRRRLKLDVIAKIDVIQSVTFNVVVVALATLKFGTWSFAVAGLVSQLSGVWLSFAAEPWKVRWHLNWNLCKGALNFGLKYQLISIVCCLKDSLSNSWLALRCGPTGVGYVSFATTTAQYPNMAGAAFTSLYLPLFSAVQSDRKALVRASETAIELNNLVVMGLASVLCGMAPSIVAIVFGAKWLPTIPLVYMFVIPTMFQGTFVPVMALCHAIGRPDIPLRYVLWSAAGTIVAAIPLVFAHGILGLGAAQVILPLFNIPLFREAQRAVPLRLAPVILPFVFCFVVNASLTQALTSCVHISNLVGLFLCCSASFLFYITAANS